jgi:hypothetical protein
VPTTVATRWSVFIDCQYLCLPKCATEPHGHAPTVRYRGELSISIPVQSAVHFLEHATNHFVGTSGEQDGELDASSSNSHVLRKMVFQG